MTPPPPLPQLRQALKAALAAAPKDASDLRHGLKHAIAAIERTQAPIDNKRKDVLG